MSGATDRERSEAMQRWENWVDHTRALVARADRQMDEMPESPMPTKKRAELALLAEDLHRALENGLKALDDYAVAMGWDPEGHDAP